MVQYDYIEHERGYDSTRGAEERVPVGKQSSISKFRLRCSCIFPSHALAEVICNTPYEHWL
jgi:hypothetical protein